MIVPDTKDWTWVLDKACPECGFDASSTKAVDVPDLISANATEWKRAFDKGLVIPGRPDDSTWSSLEYACHVRDVFRIYLERIELMLNENDPLFDNWDQDATAVADRYDEQDPRTVITELVESAEKLAEALGQIRGDQWGRPGRRSDGVAFRLATISRYMAHDPIHHLWDVKQQAH